MSEQLLDGYRRTLDRVLTYMDATSRDGQPVGTIPPKPKPPSDAYRQGYDDSSAYWKPKLDEANREIDRLRLLVVP